MQVAYLQSLQSEEELEFPYDARPKKGKKGEFCKVKIHGHSKLSFLVRFAKGKRRRD